MRAPFLILLAATPLLGSCAEDASAGTPVDSEPVVGLSLEQPVIQVPTGKTGKTGKDAIDALKDGLVEQGVNTDGQLDQNLIDQGITLDKNPLGVSVTGIDSLGKGGIKVKEGESAIAWRDLSLEGEDFEDILDKLLYPDQYEADEYNVPERIKQLEGKEVAIVGYQIPLEWEGTTVPEFMLVGDLLGCCFGGAPRPDEWINVKMQGKGSEYFPYIPVIVRGTLRIEGIEDEAGYAAGCYHIDAVSVEKEL